MSYRFSDSVGVHYTTIAEKYPVAMPGSPVAVEMQHTARQDGGRAFAIGHLRYVINGSRSGLLYAIPPGFLSGSIVTAARVRVEPLSTPRTTLLFGFIAFNTDGSICDYLNVCVRPDGHLQVLSGSSGSIPSDLAIRFGMDQFIEFQFNGIVRPHQGSFDGATTFDGLNPTWGGYSVTTKPVYLYFGGFAGLGGISPTLKFKGWDFHVVDRPGLDESGHWDSTTAVGTTVGITTAEDALIGVSVSGVEGTFRATAGKVVIEQNTGSGWGTLDEVLLSTITDANPVNFSYSLASGDLRARLESTTLGEPDTGILPAGSEFDINVGLTYTANIRVGDRAVKCVFPSAAGTYSDFTPTGAGTNVECVDEASPDEDTTYVSPDVSGEKDTYQHSALATTQGTMVGPLIFARLKMESGGVSLRPMVRHGGVDGEGISVPIVGYGPYVYWPLTIEENPSTSNPFTPDEFNAAEIGVKAESLS